MTRFLWKGIQTRGGAAAVDDRRPAARARPGSERRLPQEVTGTTRVGPNRQPPESIRTSRAKDRLAVEHCMDFLAARHRYTGGIPCAERTCVFSGGCFGRRKIPAAPWKTPRGGWGTLPHPCHLSRGQRWVKLPQGWVKLPHPQSGECRKVSKRTCRKGQASFREGRVSKRVSKRTGIIPGVFPLRGECRRAGMPRQRTTGGSKPRARRRVA